MCSCFRNWMGNDCSQRVCQFGRAHVDIPKGDLDSSGSVSGPSVTSVVNSQLYPQGTSELFPNMVDSAENVLTNTAHEYTECSSKGYCNRDNGQCNCIVGYEGSACQRASCPSIDYSVVCSGHGTCESARNLAAMDNDNIYRLWDEDITMGCKCDPGFTGVDCNSKVCKKGRDPVFMDIDGSIRYSNWSVVIYSTSRTATISGNFSFLFYDQFGEDWQTDPLQYGSTCTEIANAFEKLPNSAIPLGSVRCLRWTDYSTITTKDEPVISPSVTYYGIKYILSFPENLGKLKSIDVNYYLDGYRATMYSDDPSGPLGFFIYADGFTGQENEYFPTKCNGVDVTLLQSSNSRSTYQYFGGLSSMETRLLQQCLGSSNVLAPPAIPGRVKGTSYYWDYGSPYNPHLVRLVDKTRSHVTDLCPGSVDSVRGGGTTCIITEAPGFIVPLYYDVSLTRFVLMTRPMGDYSSTTQFAIWVTDGSTTYISNGTKVYTHPSELYSKTIYTVNSTAEFTDFTGDISCESSRINSNGALSCLEKGNFAFFLDPFNFGFNPKYMNLYSIAKIYTVATSTSYYDPFVSAHRIVLDTPINSLWKQFDLISEIRAYSFTPITSFPTFATCSNRGLCDTVFGYCTCFDGYAYDDCSKVDNTVNIETGVFLSA